MKQNIYDNPNFFKNYTALRESGINANVFIEQPAIKSLIPCLEGKSVLDLGCGDGHFSKFCIENGAKNVIGVDISKNMIERAKKLYQDDNLNFMCLPMEDMVLTNQRFDLIISSLSIHYIEDYSAMIQKINKLLKSNGKFIFSTEHPIATARKGSNHWIKTDNNKSHWALDNYQEEGIRVHNWFVEDRVVIYHRTVATLINTLIEHGLSIDKIIEPQATLEGIKKMPDLINESRSPSFIIIQSKKTNNN
ncbi:class I SAM-dependent methyltransferase [Sutcliffiella horikoshii]|uniref:Class I SAM-dependent methyltransferase n=1 Tax=Sutcliffiella horikoshii TaxID=79883 RepID=A0A5D4T0D4_9BACI|nr:class I SAM-dependent methyltransferase [Sutcliffiella horikoshii]TYS67714.1 class I SAM-dependent methyltransferase [Sutcliffiella horikoshii]